MKNRLFVAAEIPQPAFSEIIEIKDRVFNNYPIRWEPISKLHLTLKFLGDTPVELIEPLANALLSVTNSFQAFFSNFTGFGIFYRNKKPAILWVGLNNNDNLIELFSKIEKVSVELGFPKETRVFKPHITLARLKGNENLSLLNEFINKKLSSEKFNINKINLIRSKLLPTGSVYSVVKSFNLIEEE